MTTIESSVLHCIEEFNPAKDLGCKVVEWRNSNPNIGRKAIATAGLIATGLAMLVDIIINLALTILTAPAYLFGSSIPEILVNRVYWNGFTVGIVIPITLYENLISKDLSEAVQEDIEAFFDY